jgi:hypothetical protein
MINLKSIVFDSLEYKLREIHIPRIGNVNISTTRLSAALLQNGSGYVSDEAQVIDEKIYFFVEDREIELTNKELQNLVRFQTT